VTAARLLGFVRGRCVSGREKGLVLVRSIWRAEVALGPWRPQYEIQFRRTIPASDLTGHLWIEPGAEPIYARAAREAALTFSAGGWLERSTASRASTRAKAMMTSAVAR
jgi:hypothetical protein